MKSSIQNSQWNRFTLIEPVAVINLCLFLLAVSMPAFALDCSDPKHADKPKCQDDGGSGGGHGSLVAKFALAMEPSLSGLGLHSDGYVGTDGIYYDSNKHKVQIFTGEGPGFRFDTNQSSTGKSRAVRFVNIHFQPGFVAYDQDGNAYSYVSGDHDIDFRFEMSSGALELGDLVLWEPATVPIGVKIQSADKTQSAHLGYGTAPKLFSNPNLDPTCMYENTLDAVVTRIAEDAWTIESDPANPNACLWVGGIGFEGLESFPLQMPFHFTIVIDE